MEPYLHTRHILSISTQINTLLCADIPVIISDLEDNLQGAEFTLQNIAKNLELKYHQKNLRRWHIQDKTQ